jgi:hypothetical protein
MESHFKYSADSGEHPFRYGFFLYCIVHDKVEADIARVELRGKICISLERPCPSHSASRECRFRSKAITMDFCPSSSFAVRNMEDHFTEWGKVGGPLLTKNPTNYHVSSTQIIVNRAYSYLQAFEIHVSRMSSNLI